MPITSQTLRETGKLCREFLQKGFPCRGAITSGSLFHHERYIVGPALVRAYQIEQSVAIYPRIILDDAAMKRWRYHFRPPWEESLETLVKLGGDGLCFLDIFNP